MAEASTRRRFSWYRSLSMREQRLIATMLLLAVFCALYYAVWIPVERRYKAAGEAYRHELELLRWVRANEAKVQDMPSATSASDATPLPTLIANMAKDNHFTVTRLEATAEDKVTLALEHAPFNDFISAINELGHTHHVTVLTAALAKSDVPGQVNVTLQLEK